MSSAPHLHVVLDTNVVLDLLHFDDASVLPIRQAIEARRAQCYASDNTLSEFCRVLAYPEFALAPPAQANLLLQYRSWINHAPVVTSACTNLPRCTDPDDQMFLELAASAAADWLISKDKALLALKRKVSGFRILTPGEAANFL